MEPQSETATNAEPETRLTVEEPAEEERVVKRQNSEVH